MYLSQSRPIPSVAPAVKMGLSEAVLHPLALQVFIAVDPKAVAAADWVLVSPMGYCFLKSAERSGRTVHATMLSNARRIVC